MAFNELDRMRIERMVGALCRRRSPAHLRSKGSLEYAVHRQEVLIFTRRPEGDDPGPGTELPVAKLRYTRKSNHWKLYWQRGNTRWVAYEPLPESRELEELVDEMDRDPYGVFFD